MPRHAVAGHRARGEPHGSPREPLSPEVAHDEAQSYEIGEPAEQRGDPLLGKMMKNERADRDVDRARPDGRLERVAGDDVHLRGTGDGPLGVSEDRGVDVEGDDPHPVSVTPRPSRERQRDVRRPRCPRRGRGGSRRPVAARRTARRAAGWTSWRRSGSAARCRGDFGSSRPATRQVGPSARCARLRGAAVPARSLESKQRALGGEPGAERHHESHVAGPRAAAPQDRVQDEEHGGRGQVAEAAEDVTGVLDVVVGQAEQDLGVLDHPAAGGVQDPEPHVLLREPVVLEEGSGQLLHHRGRDPPHLGRQAYPVDAAREGEPHAVQVLRTDQCSVAE